MENGTTPADRAYMQAMKEQETYGENVLSMSKSERSKAGCGTEKRIEMDVKVTDLLHIKCDEETGKYYVALWGMGISNPMETQAECMELIKKSDPDMLITAMYGIASQLIKENNEKQ